jgi:hypothetical protein
MTSVNVTPKDEVSSILWYHLIYLLMTYFIVTLYANVQLQYSNFCSSNILIAMYIQNKSQHTNVRNIATGLYFVLKFFILCF